MSVVPIAAAPLDVTGGAQRQLDKTEAPVPSVVSAEEENKAKVDDSLDPKYQALARREKAIRRQIQSLRQKEMELKAKEEQTSRFVDPSKFQEDLKKRAQSDPLSVMQELGLTYDQLTNLMLNQPSAEAQELQRLKQEILTIKEAQGKTIERFDQEQQKAYDQAVKQIQSEAVQMVHSDERFETVKEMNQVDAAVELIKLNFEKEGTLMSIEEALESVETYLVDEAVRWAKLKKVQAKLTPAEAAVMEQQATANEVPKANTWKRSGGHNVVEKTQQQQQPLKTLTHRETVSATSPLTGKDRRQRAILAFQGILNK